MPYVDIYVLSTYKYNIHTLYVQQHARMRVYIYIYISVSHEREMHFSSEAAAPGARRGPCRGGEPGPSHTRRMARGAPRGSGCFLAEEFGVQVSGAFFFCLGNPFWLF